jgi:hypothetical protein
MKYEVTNPTQTPRVLHDVHNTAKFIPPGQMRVIDLHDHDVERLKAAKSDEVTLVEAAKPATSNKK